jgi:hypothetical protein
LLFDKQRFDVIKCALGDGKGYLTGSRETPLARIFIGWMVPVIRGADWFV